MWMNKIRESLGGKKAAAVTILGMAGLFLVMLSSILPDKKQTEAPDAAEFQTYTAEEYCRSTEKRLEEFLKNIEGAGDVEVYLTVGTTERYVYAAEEKKTMSENKTEREAKYVIVGGGGEREPLIETVEVPEITGAVVVCKGCGDPAVQERIYRAASAALGIPTGKIYVTKMK